MRTYRRATVDSGVYFLTLHLVQRRGESSLVTHIDKPRDAFKRVRTSYAGKSARGSDREEVISMALSFQQSGEI